MRGMFSNGRYANVTATLSLVVALGGTSYAAITVTSKDIRNRTIRSVDIADNTITSRKIRNASLLARDFRAGQLPAGPTGPQGAPGTNGAASVILRDAFTGLIAAGEEATVNVPCAAGEKAFSGGVYGSSFSVSESVPTTAPVTGAAPTGWRVVGRNVAGAPNALHAFAVCAAP